jgi:hypothetical protein
MTLREWSMQGTGGGICLTGFHSGDTFRTTTPIKTFDPAGTCVTSSGRLYFLEGPPRAGTTLDSATGLYWLAVQSAQRRH